MTEEEMMIKYEKRLSKTVLEWVDRMTVKYGVTRRKAVEVYKDMYNFSHDQKKRMRLAEKFFATGRTII